MTEAEEQQIASSQASETRYDRVRRAFKYATQHVQPGDEVPEMPRELADWGKNTAIAMFAGICFLGGRQFVRHSRLGPYIPQQAGLSKGQQTKLITDENSKRLLRIISEAIKGGVQFGSLAGLFYGVQMLSSVANGEKSIGDTVLAATAAGGVFGGFLPGAGAQKLRSSVIGAALGASAGFPVGFLQLQVDSRLVQDTPEIGAKAAPPARKYPELKRDSTEAVIRQLEAGIRK